MTISVRGIQTGSFRCKTAQRVRKPGGTLRILTDRRWTEWQPIFAWVIDHPEGTIVVDTGDNSRTSEPSYFPAWHPYYWGSLQIKVEPEEEIGPRLRALGTGPDDVSKVILTHFHTDHVGGLHHFPNNRIFAPAGELKLARSLAGRLAGYLPDQLPAGFDPEPIPFGHGGYDPFDQTHRVTEAGDVLIVPTPGHTPGHVSVVVKTEKVTYFLAGDASFSEKLLLDQTPDGVSPDPAQALETMKKISVLAGHEPLVYLPSHDPESVVRLRELSPLEPVVAEHPPAG